MGGPRERFPRTSRLRRSREFQHVAHLGQRMTSEHFVVLFARRDAGSSAAPLRLGVTVSRRVGSAVVRNRVKRGVREWFRRSHASLNARGDLVVIARPGAARLGAKEISQELTEVLC